MQSLACCLKIPSKTAAAALQNRNRKHRTARVTTVRLLPCDVYELSAATTGTVKSYEKKKRMADVKQALVKLVFDIKPRFIVICKHG